MTALTPAVLKASLAKLGYHWHTDAPNLIGIRRSVAVPDAFNDVLACCWRQPALPPGLALLDQQRFLAKWWYVGKDGKLIKADGLPGANTAFALQRLAATAGTDRLRQWAVTTVPGVRSLRERKNAKGCAVLVPGQYKNAYQLGLHKRLPGHEALVQSNGAVRVYRDNDGDVAAEETALMQTGSFGINIHRTDDNLKYGVTQRVANWSEGCQVFPKMSDHAELLSICREFKTTCANCFSYTLLRERELVLA